MRLHRRGRRTATLATLLALALAAPITATATHATATGAKAPTPSADDIHQYEIHQSTTPVTRTAIQRTGVTVDEADEETVVVSGRADQAKKLRQLGYDVLSWARRRTAPAAPTTSASSTSPRPTRITTTTPR